MEVTHTIEPIYSEDSKILILGTMPSPISREVGFYYGNPRNRFWRVISALLGEELPETNNGKRQMALDHGIAIWDVLQSCDIEGASDSSIKNAKPNDIVGLIENSSVKAIFTTGAKANALYRRFFGDLVSIECIALPSTSPANAAASLEALIDAYRVILDFIS